jgi:hypothetical protein
MAGGLYQDTETEHTQRNKTMNVSINLESFVARTILTQLGGGQFIAMTGAAGFVMGPRSLTFRVPRIKGCSVNRVCITLTPWDDYTIEGFRAKGLDCTPIQRLDNVYAGELRGAVARMIKRDLSL